MLQFNPKKSAKSTLLGAVQMNPQATIRTLQHFLPIGSRQPIRKIGSPVSAEDHTKD
jgi:hypothetical protein